MLSTTDCYECQERFRNCACSLECIGSQKQFSEIWSFSISRWNIWRLQSPELTMRSFFFKKKEIGHVSVVKMARGGQQMARSARQFFVSKTLNCVLLCYANASDATFADRCCIHVSPLMHVISPPQFGRCQLSAICPHVFPHVPVCFCRRFVQNSCWNGTMNTCVTVLHLQEVRLSL